MNKTVIIIILAVVSLGLLGYIVSGNVNSNNLKPAEARELAEKFVNESLLPPGVTADIGEAIEESGLYKMVLNLPDGTEINSYVSKDAKLFFPEGINIEEVTKTISDNLENNNQNQMELKKEILTEGSGDAVVKNGDNITVDYTGILEDGTQFDSSIGRAPFSFTIGQGSVIQGWDQGLIGMKVGEEIKLTIPSDMAYGSNGAGSIPPNATLIFTIKLISID